MMFLFQVVNTQHTTHNTTTFSRVNEIGIIFKSLCKIHLQRVFLCTYIFIIEERLHNFSIFAAHAQQSEDAAPKKEDSFEAELCKDKDAGEWFRLVAGEGDNCRDVIQCTSSVS